MNKTDKQYIEYLERKLQNLEWLLAEFIGGVQEHLPDTHKTPHNPTDAPKRTIPVIDIADVPKLIERREMAQKAGNK